MAVLFVAGFIAFSAFYASASNGVERVSDAYQDDADRMLDQQNTDIVITSLSCSNGLNVSIENTGATTLSVVETDVLVDNEYRSSFSVREVDGNDNTDLWFPGESLNLEANDVDATRVKVVTGPGISRTEGC